MLYILETTYNNFVPFNPRISIEYREEKQNYLGKATLDITHYQSISTGKLYSKEFTPEEIAKDLRKELLHRIKTNQFLGYHFIVLRPI